MKKPILREGLSSLSTMTGGTLSPRGVDQYFTQKEDSMACKTAKKAVVDVSISQNGAGCEEVVRKRAHELYEEQGTPQPLPGPGASRRIAWASGLQEPEDAPSRHGPRNGFPHFDDFLAILERDMSVVETELSAQNREKLEAPVYRKPEASRATALPSFGPRD